MAKRIFLDGKMQSLSLEIDSKTDVCKIIANLKNGGKQLLLEKIPYLQARHLYAQACLELNKINKDLLK